MTPQVKGMLWGSLGVLCFSVTLPASRAAVASFDPLLVALGRGVVAAVLAAVLLLIGGQPRPRGPQVRRVAVVALCVVLGFPILMTWAMRRVPAAHGAVMLGVLPLLTAMAGTWRARERPSRLFWLLGIIGSGSVVGFAWSEGGGSFSLADAALLGSAVFAAVGYAEGAVLARELGGWQVISWAMVFAGPLLLGPFLWLASFHTGPAAGSAWAGFTYVCVVSAYLGFFPWYRGLALGGVAKVGQVQLLQPFVTMAFAALFMGEPLGLKAVAVAAFVAVLVYWSRKCQVREV